MTLFPLEDFHVTSVFGAQEEGLHKTPHRGLDAGAKYGSTVYSPDNGTVEKIVWNSVLEGNMIQIRMNDNSLHYFMHLSGIKVNEGQVLHAGEKIGAVGSSGHSTGAHLHWGVKVNGQYVDPMAWLKGNKSSDSSYGTASRVEFAQGVLKQIQAPTSQKNIAFMLAWMDQENTKASFNPLATTKRSGDAQSFNRANVKNYRSMEEGIQATASTIANGRYNTILSSLQANRPEDSYAASSEWHTWTGEGNYAYRIARKAEQYRSNPALMESGTLPTTARNVDGSQTRGKKPDSKSAVDSFFAQAGALSNAQLLASQKDKFGTEAVAWLKKIGFKVA